MVQHTGSAADFLGWLGSSLPTTVGHATAVIEGKPGFGKTALLDSCAAMAEQAGFTVLQARCSALETSFENEIVRQLVHQGSQRAQPDGSSEIDAPVGPVDKISQLYREVSRLADSGPVVVIVDDLHWCDRRSSEALRYLARRTRPGRLWLLAATVPHSPLLPVNTAEAIMAEPITFAFRLQTLRFESVCEVIRIRLMPNPSSELIEGCHNASGGNPFLLTSLVAELTRLEAPDDAALLNAIGTASPSEVARSIRARLTTAPAGSKAVLGTIALLGEAADLTSVAELTSMDSAAIIEAVDALVGAWLLRGDQPFRFCFPLEQSTVYGEMPPATRARAHSQAAKLLIDRDARFAEVAKHLIATDPSGDGWTVDHLDQYANSFLAAGEHELALRCLRRALLEPLDAQVRSRLLIAASHVETNRGAATALSYLHDAAELGATPMALAGPMLQLARVLEDSRYRVDLAAQMRDISRRFDDGDPSCDTIRLELEIGASADQAPQDNQTSAATILSILGGRLKGTSRLERLALGQLSSAFAHDPVRWSAGSIARLAQQLVDIDELDVHDIVDVRIWARTLATLAKVGRFELVISIGRHAQGLAIAARSNTATAEFSNLLAYTFLLQGSLEMAETECHRAIDALQISSDAAPCDAVQQAMALFAAVKLARGQGQEARHLLDDGLDEETISGLMVLELRGQILLEAGELEESLRVLHRARRWARAWAIDNPAVSNWRGLMAAALYQAGHVRRAVALAHENLTLARAFGAPRTLGSALRTTAAVAEHVHRLSLLSEAVQVLEDSGSTLELALALIDLGTLLLGQQDTQDRARDYLRLGADAAFRCGAAPLVDRAQRELRAAGGRPRRAALSGAGSLTPMEEKVAQLASAGYANSQIAEMLFVSNKTVEGHLSRIYRKLGIRSRRELAASLHGDGATGDGQRISGSTESPNPYRKLTVSV